MPEFFRANWKYLLGAAFLHLLFAGVFGLTMIQMERDAPKPQLAIQAFVVDGAKLGRAPARKPTPPQPDPAREREREQAAAKAREEAAAAEKKQQEEQVQKQRETEQRAEQERQADVKKREDEAQQVREREAAEQKRVAEEAERKRAADEERQRHAEAERKRVADIERRQKEEAEKRRAADDARVQEAREDELRNQLKEEEGRMSAENSGLLNQYVAMIEQRIVRNWNRPATARSGLECEVKVAQTPGGAVLSVQIGRCNGDAAVKQSIEAAVLRASPLPPPPDPRLFERNLLLVFRPAD
jgi:colicin import membrane protein